MQGFDDATIRELSVAASVDPRTIRKILRGEQVRGMAGKRARAALARHRRKMGAAQGSR
jgi:hypothetical protein